MQSHARVNRVTLAAAMGVATVMMGACSLVLASNRDVPTALAGHASTIPQTIQESFRLPSADLPFGSLVQFYRGKALFEVDMARWLRAEKGAELLARNADGCSGCHLSGGRNGVHQQGHYLAPLAPIVVFEPEATVSDVDNSPGAHKPQENMPLKQAVKLIWQQIEFATSNSRHSLVYPRINATSEQLGHATVRITPSLIGLGLIEQIEDEDIKQWYDQYGLGKISIAEQNSQDKRVGRFGFKARHASIRRFVESALREELGIHQEYMLSDTQLDDLEFYSRELGVPTRREAGPAEGFLFFQQAGCGICHRPSYHIRRTSRSKEYPVQIWPFSDFLLHDLGYPDQATKEYWRTTPLWGLGRVEGALGYGAYMHDGRARTLQEAILWHGGEAAQSRQAFLDASQEEQLELLAFLMSL